jgi:hypothetical protein
MVGVGWVHIFPEASNIDWLFGAYVLLSMDWTNKDIILAVKWCDWNWLYWLFEPFGITIFV